MTKELASRWRAVLFVVAGVAVVLTMRGGSVNSSTSPSTPAVPQDVMSLDRRITTLEQKLYPLESSLRRLEQQTLTLGRSTPTQPLRDPELDRLRGEVELLRARVRELECALLRVDERTLSAAMKEARRRAGAQVDACRQNADAPVQLSIRQ